MMNGELQRPVMGIERRDESAIWPQALSFVRERLIEREQLEVAAGEAHRLSARSCV